MFSRNRVGAALLASIAAASPLSAIPLEWSAAELDCAKRIDINIDRPADPSATTYVRYLTWMADVIVYAHVAEVSHDIEGDFHTRLKLTVISVKKGSLPEGPVYVDLVSGPAYIPSRAKIGKVELLGEPSFKEGETVLLFLSASSVEITGRPAAFSLLPGHYRLSNNVKWRVEGDTAKDDEITPNERKLKWIDDEITLAVSSQESNCQNLDESVNP